MSACEVCMYRSVLENEAFGYAEQCIDRPATARRLLELDEAELIARLREQSSDVEGKLRRKAEALLTRSNPAWTLCRHSTDYPKPMCDLDQQPWVIFGVGDPAMAGRIEVEPTVAIVGARRASSNGREMAYVLARDLARAGITVISGMALGIDGAAHRGALAGGGATVAVLAGGPDRAYPRSHSKLYEEIRVSGAVISERPPGSRAMKWGFPARNRLIAALGLATIVVEATMNSGSRHTSDFAHELNRDVGAVPGPVASPLSDGPHELISEGAKLIRGSDDVLDMLKLEFQRELPRRSESDELIERVHTCVCSGEVTPQAMTRRLPGVSIGELMRALGQLELDQRVRRDHAGAYRPRIRNGPTR